MCRFMVYKGHNSMLMADLLTHPTRSIITQSYASKERIQSNLNGDGFGVGWYLPSEDPVSAKEDPRVPCVFTSVTPAWNNLNLKRIARTVSSPLIFAHVRAAMPGMLVTEANCHPFQCGRFMFMHNGGIADFLKIYRKARECLRDDLFNFVQGTTDSEIIFALFLNQIGDYMGDFGSDELVFKIVATLKKILQLQLEAGGSREASLLNLAVTDGRTVIATRFVDKSEASPATLYFSSGTKFECRSHGNHSDEYHMTKTEKRDSAVIITSEPLTDNPKDWVPVPRNHVVVITPDLTVKLIPINLTEVEYQPVPLSQNTISLNQQRLNDNTPEHKFLNGISDKQKRKHESESLHTHSHEHSNGHSKVSRKVYETADISELEETSRESQECRCIHTLQEHTDNVLSIAIKDDLIFSGSADGTIKVWDSAAYQLVDTLTGHTGSIFSLSISHNTLFSASADSSIMVWNISKHPIAHVTKIVSNISSIFSLAVSETHLFAGYQDASVKASDLSPFGDRNPRSLHGETHHGYVYCLSVMQNTKGDLLLASGAGDGTIKVWDARQFVLSETLVGHSRSVLCLGTDPEIAERSMILYSGSRDGTIKVWELLEFGNVSGKSVNHFQCTRTLTGHQGDVLCLSVSKRRLFTGSADGTVKVWDRDQLICQRTIPMGNSVSNFSRMFPLCLAAITNDTVLVGCANMLQVWHCEMATQDNSNPNSPQLSDFSVPTKHEAIIDTLSQFVALKSVSGDPLCRSDCWKAAKYMMHLFESVGAESRLINVDEHSEKNPIVLARLGSNRQHPTITIYGHYDVVPAAIEDGWDSDPFVLSGRDGYLYGRGVTDNKGPLVACIYAIRELQRESKDLGVNIVFVVEGEEERDSDGFKECIAQHRNWFDGTEVTLIINTYWLGDVKPCLIYGLRGTIDLEIELSGPKQDLHSGLDGGNIHEPFHELSYLLSQLTDGNGNILVPTFYDKVRQIGTEESALLDNVDFDMKQYQQYYGIQSLKASSVKDFLVRRWCKPSLSVIGVNSSSSKGNAISKSVIGKINIRTVPDQSASEISKLLTNYINQKFSDLGSSNRCEVRVIHTGEPWLGNITNRFYKAASKSIEAVWKTQPMFVREGGTIPVTPFLEQSFQAPVLHFPMGQSSDRAHLQNERIRVENLIKGKDVLKNFVKEIRSSRK